MPLPDALHVVLRAAIPLIGVLFLGWSAANLLFVYCADTLASIYVVCVLACGRLFAIDAGGGPAWWRRLSYGMQLGLTALILWLVIAVPMAAMMAFVLTMANFDWQAALHDRHLGLAVMAQFGGAVGLLLREYRFVLAQRDVDRRIKRGFGLAFLRWAIVLIAGWALLAARPIYGIALIAIASLTTIALELHPDRVLRAFNAGELAAPQDARARLGARGRR